MRIEDCLAALERRRYHVTFISPCHKSIAAHIELPSKNMVTGRPAKYDEAELVGRAFIGQCRFRGRRA